MHFMNFQKSMILSDYNQLVIYNLAILLDYVVIVKDIIYDKTQA
jgi:hypothetical protein